MSEIPYMIYGTGHRLLFAFHGYGMDGRQFQVLRDSLCSEYRVIGFHLPYHRQGPTDHHEWFNGVIEEIHRLIYEDDVREFSIAGYSIGSKVALATVPHFRKHIRDIYLFAPYGLTTHWGLSFLESNLGKWFFSRVVDTSLPGVILNLCRSFGIINEVDLAILKEEVATRTKRRNLAGTFQLMSELKIDMEEVVSIFNSVSGRVRLIFGIHDHIFSPKRFKKVDQLERSEMLVVEEGHWMMTQKLEALLLTSA